MVTVGGGHAWGRHIVHEYQPRRPTQEQQAECQICCTTLPMRAFVKFLPCEHEACLTCLHELRKEAIRKASQGVKCPYCRSYIGRFEANSSSDAQAFAVCEQATAVAEKAARARGGVVDVPVRNHVDLMAASDPHGWPCTFCQHGNRLNTQVCQQCGKPKVDVCAEPVDRVDILDMNRDELRNCALQKHHPRLNMAFEDLGLQIVDGKCAIMLDKTALREAVAPTLGKGGAERFLHIFKSLASPFCMKQLSYHYHGNNLIQLAVCVAAAIRDALPTAPQADFIDHAHKVEMEGLFGLMLRSLQLDYADMAEHPQGLLVLDCLVENARPSGLMDVADEIGQSLTRLLSLQWGFKFIDRILDRLTMLLSSPDEDLQNDVVDTLGYMCDYASADPQALAAIPLRIDNVKIIGTLLRCAVPRQGALWLAEEVAKLVPRMMFHQDGSVFTPGLQCLNVLLQLNQGNLQSGPPCLYRDMVCLFALHIRGNLATLLLLAPSSLQMVKLLLNRFEADQEGSWIDFLLQELIQGICEDEQLLRMDALTTLMGETLASPLLGESYRTDLMDMTAGLNEKARTVLEEKVLMCRMQRRELPAPLYYEQSRLRPTALNDFIAGRLPRPPPPPPPLSMTNSEPKRLPQESSGFVLTQRPTDLARYEASTQATNGHAGLEHEAIQEPFGRMLGPQRTVHPFEAAHGGQTSYEQRIRASGYECEAPQHAGMYRSQPSGGSPGTGPWPRQERGAPDMGPYTDPNSAMLSNGGYSGRPMDTAPQAGARFDANDRNGVCVAGHVHPQGWQAAPSMQGTFGPPGSVAKRMQSLSISGGRMGPVHGVGSEGVQLGEYGVGHGQGGPSVEPQGRGLGAGVLDSRSSERGGWPVASSGSQRQSTLVDTARGPFLADAYAPSLQRHGTATMQSGGAGAGSGSSRSMSGVYSGYGGYEARGGGAENAGYADHRTGMPQQPSVHAASGGGRGLAAQSGSGYGETAPQGHAMTGGAARATDNSWTCKACTYKHEGNESMFLTCGMCGTDKA
jgi:hypothetical protein